MKRPLMFGNAVGGNVPTAAVAGRGLVVAAVAVERAAVEELLQPVTDVRSEVALVGRQRHDGAATVAVARIELLEQRQEMIVDAAADQARAVAQRAGQF